LDNEKFILETATPLLHPPPRRNFAAHRFRENPLKFPVLEKIRERVTASLIALLALFVQASRIIRQRDRQTESDQLHFSDET
jgi:hypothetical protein